MNGNDQIMTTPTSGLRLFDRIAGVADRGTWLPVGVFVALVAIFSFASPAFFTWRNFAATTGEAATLLIASLGATFVILMGSIDLSVGAVVLLVGTTTVAALKLFQGADLGPLAIPFGALLGAALGAFNGAIIVFGRVPSFVVTLGSLSVFTGIALSILAGATIMFDSPFFDVLSLRQTIPHLPNIALVGAALMADLHICRRAHSFRSLRHAHWWRRAGRAHGRNPCRPLQDLRLYRVRPDCRTCRHLRDVPAWRRRAQSWR